MKEQPGCKMLRTEGNGRCWKTVNTAEQPGRPKKWKVKGNCTVLLACPNVAFKLAQLVISAFSVNIAFSFSSYVFIPLYLLLFSFSFLQQIYLQNIFFIFSIQNLLQLKASTGTTSLVTKWEDLGKNVKQQRRKYECLFNVSFSLMLVY